MIASPAAGLLSQGVNTPAVLPACVTLVPLGSTQRRYEALTAGRTSATMLALPWSAMALEAGFSLLGDRDRVLPGIQGSCGASLGIWLDTHPGTADAYLKALCAAITWLNHPGNLHEANRYILMVGCLPAQRIGGGLRMPHRVTPLR